MSINTADKVPNSDIAEIMSHLRTEDCQVEFKGYTHNKSGFVLQILFVEHVDDLRQWDYKGYECDAQIDLNNRLINLYYTKKKGSRIGFNLVYLSIIAVCIFYLWSKYRPEQNYMNQI